MKFIKADHIIIEELHADVSSALGLLYERYADFVFQQAYRRLRDVSAAQDVTQDVFVSLWQSRHRLEARDFKSYLYVCVRHQVLKFMAKEQRYCTLPDEPTSTQQIAAETAEETVRKKDFFNRYEQVLRSLTKSQQSIYQLHYTENLSSEQIASKLGISKKSVQNQLSRCRFQLKQTLLGILSVLSLLF